MNGTPCKPVVLWVTLVPCLVLLSSHPAAADGCYFPERAYKTPPTIPTQRALVVFRDSTERLIIESSLEAKGRHFGWIVPLPAKPSDIEECSSGLLTTLSHCISTRIIHDLTAIRDPMAALAGVVALWAAVVLALKPKRRLLPLLLMVLFALLLGVLLPSLGHAGRSGKDAVGVPGVHIESAEIVGNYEVTVLTATDPGALNTWLDSNGFMSLSGDGAAIVSDYIRGGWCFAATKLQRNATGLARPHPISFTFPADRPVYPMRLTALTGASVALELFVIADKRAVVNGLTTEFSDQLTKRERHYSGPHVQHLPAHSVAGRGFRVVIGHPGLPDLVWDDCCLTKLSGTITPQDMKADIIPDFRAPSPYRQKAYSRRGARDTAVLVALGAWIIGLPAWLLAVYGRIRSDKGRLFSLTRVCVPALGGTVALCGCVYALLPKTEVTTQKGGSYHTELRYVLRAVIEESIESLGPMSTVALVDVRTRLADYFTKNVMANRLSGGNVHEEDSPGNYVLYEFPDGIVVREFVRWGFVNDMFFPRKPVEYYLGCLASMRKEPWQYHWRELIWELGNTRDPRVVLPLIQTLRKPVAYGSPVDLINQQLTKITGFNFRTYRNRADAEKLYLLWTQWWNVNQSNTRRQWLEAALDQQIPAGERADQYTKRYYREARESAAAELAMLDKRAGAVNDKVTFPDGHAPD